MFLAAGADRPHAPTSRGDGWTRPENHPGSGPDNTPMFWIVIHGQTRRISHVGHGPFPEHLRNHRSAELRAGHHGPCPFQTAPGPIGRSGIECCQPTVHRIQSSLRTESIPTEAVPGSSCRSSHEPGETLIAGRPARRWAVPWSYEVKGVPKTPERGPNAPRRPPTGNWSQFVWQQYPAQNRRLPWSR